MKTQLEKAQAFVDLHRRGNCFVIPNPWDAGSAKLLQHLGFLRSGNQDGNIVHTAAVGNHAHINITQAVKNFFQRISMTGNFISHNGYDGLIFIDRYRAECFQFLDNVRQTGVVVNGE